jgi:pantothenate kinase
VKDVKGSGHSYCKTVFKYLRDVIKENLDKSEDGRMRFEVLADVKISMLVNLGSNTTCVCVWNVSRYQRVGGI